MTELESLKDLEKKMAKQMDIVKMQTKQFDDLLGKQLKTATPEQRKQYQSIMRKLKDGGANLNEDKIHEVITELETIRDVSKGNS